jgi:hypothetical protein
LLPPWTERRTKRSGSWERPPKLAASDYHGPHLYRRRGWADELLAECGHPFQLPTDAVVFWTHQGYQFLYFRPDGCTENPPMFHFMEGMTAQKRQFERFSWWVAVAACR